MRPILFLLLAVGCEPVPSEVALDAASADFLSGCDLDDASADLGCVNGRVQEVHTAIGDCALAAGLTEAEVMQIEQATWSDEASPIDGPAAEHTHASFVTYYDATATHFLPCRVSTVDREISAPLLEELLPLLVCPL